MNLNNNGQVLGRLTRDPKVSVNKDGSLKIFLTVASRNSYKSKQSNEYESQFIQLQAYVKSESAKKHPFMYMNKGDRVQLGYEVLTNNYEDKDGEMHYGQTLNVTDVNLLENKGSKDDKATTKKTAKKSTKKEEETPLFDLSID